MKYHFSTNKYIDASNGLEKSNPLIYIEEQEKYGCFFIDEIQNLSFNIEYVKNIVSKLESLLNGEVCFYDGFGYEVYLIECKKDIIKVINTFENYTVEAEIPTQEIYELMRDWRDYLVEWAQKNNHSLR